MDDSITEYASTREDTQNMASGAVKEYSVEDEYKKNPHITREDIAKLRAWVNRQTHLPAGHISDLDIILTYHCCGRSAEVAKQVLDLNYTLRTLFTGFFKDRKMDCIERTLNAAYIGPLSSRSHDGYTCFYTRLFDFDAKKFILVDIIKSIMMILDLEQYEEGTWPGLMFIFDFEGISLSHLAAFDVQVLQQFIYYLQEAMLVNLKGLHVLNAPSFVDMFVAMVKPFMKKELMDMLHIHQVNSKTIDRFYPIDALPCNNGDVTFLQQRRDELIAKLRANQGFFDEESKKRVVESRRPGKAKTITDYFGSTEGSFKKLNLD